VETQRQEAVRQEAARVEAARLDAERQEVARQAAAQLEAQRREAARQEVARVETARLEAARQATAPQEASRVEVGQGEAAKREAVLQAIGRQLDEEAARREAAAAAAPLPNTLPNALRTARRVRLWGRTDPNAELVQYAEAWARKIQFNTAVDTVRDVAKRPHTHPLVTVAVRSDGSVEAVTFVVSSGVVEVDEAIRRIVESQRPYPRFPPALAREFDVVEIRRTWTFDSAVRLY
jgi:outer membrane biosynthesis protein TonB